MSSTVLAAPGGGGARRGAAAPETFVRPQVLISARPADGADPDDDAVTYWMPDAALRTDAELLARPAPAVLTEPKLFLCTYAAEVAGLKKGVEELKGLLTARWPVVALNSNFSHSCLPGYESLVKTVPRSQQGGAPSEKGAKPSIAKPRKLQGDGTCFNSSIEPVVRLGAPDGRSGRNYFMRVFPTSGEIQVAGVVSCDLSDGAAAVDALVAWLDSFDAVKQRREDGKGLVPIRLVPGSNHPTLMNVRFRIHLSCDRVLLNLQAITEYLRAAAAGVPSARFPALVPLPYTARELKAAIGEPKVTFVFLVPVEGGEPRKPRINIFQSGKINILGSNCPETSMRIYEWFVRVYSDYWGELVCLKPRRDRDRPRATAAAAAGAAAAAARPTMIVRTVEAAAAATAATTAASAATSAMTASSGSDGEADDVDSIDAILGIERDSVDAILGDLDNWSM